MLEPTPSEANLDQTSPQEPGLLLEAFDGLANLVGELTEMEAGKVLQFAALSFDCSGYLTDGGLVDTVVSSNNRSRLWWSSPVS